MTDTTTPFRSGLKKLRALVDVATENIRHVPKRVLDVRIRLILLRGTIRGTDETATMLYVGRGHTLAYLRGKLLLDTQEIQSKTSTLFTYRAHMAEFETAADFTFVDIGLPYQNAFLEGGEHLILPGWVSMIVPLDGDWDSIASRFNKTTRKMTRRISYSYEVSRDPEVIGRFYDDFYLPYVSMRHEDAAIDARSTIEARARDGGILQVIGEDGPVVAGVVYPLDGVLYYLWLGMAKDKLDTPPEDALFASYYFCLRYAHENGFRASDWQGTRAFPTDGVFQFKRKWGAYMEDSFSPDAVLFRPAPNNQKAIAFAQTFPFIARRGDLLEQVFCTTAQTLTEADVKRLIAGYSCGGIDRITIAHVTPDVQNPEVWQPKFDPKVNVVRITAQQFARIYARDFSAENFATATDHTALSGC